MPPSQKGTSFKRKDTQMLSSISISPMQDPQRQARHASRSPSYLSFSSSQRCQSKQENHPLDLATRNSTSNLRSISCEQIYPMKNPSWAVGNSDQKMVMLHMI